MITGVRLRVGFKRSLIERSAVERLAGAGILAALLWVVIGWALS